MIGAKDIATDAVEQLRANIRTGIADRDKNASGNTSKGIDVLPSGNDLSGGADLEADGHWRWVGNGRGPGGRPPIGRLRQWIANRGLSISAYALANKIAREGTRDFRLKRTNIFLDEIKAWEEVDVPKAEELFADLSQSQLLGVIDDVKFN